MTYIADNLTAGLYVAHVAFAIGVAISAVMTCVVFVLCGFDASEKKDKIALRNLAIALVAFSALWLITPARPEPNAPAVAEDARP